jgi:DNA polymerase III subunit epsilon
MRRPWSPGPRERAAAEFARTRTPARETPWREARWCAIDLELTGLDPRANDIIAIGAVPIEEGRVVLGESAYTLVRSSRRSEHGAVLVHKLRLPDVADAPVLDDALDLLFSVLAGRVPVFHTAVVERNFLRPLFSRRRVRLPDAADTEVLGRRWLRGRDGETLEWLSLARLAEVLGLPAEPPHHALGDALTTAKSFIALASHLDAVEPQTVRTLVSAGSRLGGVRRFGPGL